MRQKEVLFFLPVSILYPKHKATIKTANTETDAKAMIIVSSRLNEWGGPKRKQKSILFNTDKIAFRKVLLMYNQISNIFHEKKLQKN